MSSHADLRNGTGIRIAADQDHGIRPLPPEQSGRPESRPYHHLIRRNSFQDNRIGVELVRTDQTFLEENLFSHNVEAHLCLHDAGETTVRNNPGMVGAGI